MSTPSATWECYLKCVRAGFTNKRAKKLAYIKSNGVAGGCAQGAGVLAHEVVLSLVDLVDEGEGAEGGAE